MIDEQPASPDEQPITLDALSQAFAEVLGKPTRCEEGEPAGATGSPQIEDLHREESRAAEAPVEIEQTAAEESSRLSPETIFEAMLFVGCPGDEPLSPQKAADLMRGVEAGEVPALVEKLNTHYDALGCPYSIRSEGAGYRLVLRDELSSLREKFYGRTREARLSQAAIDILAIVAYRQPIGADEVTQLRGVPSTPLLTQLVRRRLLRIERPDTTPRRILYYTSDRFLQLFGLQSLADLPRSEDLEGR